MHSTRNVFNRIPLRAEGRCVVALPLRAETQLPLSGVTRVGRLDRWNPAGIRQGYGKSTVIIWIGFSGDSTETQRRAGGVQRGLVGDPVGGQGEPRRDSGGGQRDPEGVRRPRIGLDPTLNIPPGGRRQGGLLLVYL